MQTKPEEGRLPDFVVIGAAKAGTTSLDFYLGLHPEIFMARPKELRFFVDAPLPTGRWSLGEDWYTRQFITRKPACGESSPQYAISPRAPERMAAVVPNAKLIYLVREPMARLRSQYLMEVRRGVFVGSFAAYVEQRPPAVDHSCYGNHLERFLAHFSCDRIMMVESQELHVNRFATLQRIFRFLGVDDAFVTPRFHLVRHVGESEVFPTPLGMRLDRSRLMRHASRMLPSGVHHHLRNLVLSPFPAAPPSTALPEAKESELASLFRVQVELLRKLTGLSLPSLSLPEIRQ